MKRILMIAMSLLSCYAIADTVLENEDLEDDDFYEGDAYGWLLGENGESIDCVFYVDKHGAQVGCYCYDLNTAIPQDTEGAITIPSTMMDFNIGVFPVIGIGEYAFFDCKGLTSVTMPSSVTSIGACAFCGCDGLTSVTIPEGVTNIDSSAFEYCRGLTSVTIPSNVTYIGGAAFKDCTRLTDVYFLGDTVVASDSTFQNCNWDMIIHVPATWEGRRKTMCGYPIVKEGSAETGLNTSVTVTNITIHYVLNSVQPTKVIPASMDAGFVNIITEVTSGGVVSVPATWMANYPNYVTKFGSDFTKSLMKTTGKKDGANQPMRVWQDYVAGTDPTDENDIFTASITTDANGKIIVSYNPELSDDEKAKRIYTTLGKVKLTDSDWVEVPSGHEADYNFFKVTVEMK